MSDKAEFTVTGTVSRKPMVFGKLGKVMLVVTDDKGRRGYIECVSFEPEQVGQIREGERVTIRGRINRRKLEGVTQPSKDGTRQYDVWETQLIANSITPADDAAHGAQPPLAGTKHRTERAGPPTAANRNPGAPIDDGDVPF